MKLTKYTWQQERSQAKPASGCLSIGGSMPSFRYNHDRNTFLASMS